MLANTEVPYHKYNSSTKQAFASISYKIDLTKMLLIHLASPGKPLHQVSVSSAANSERENSSVVVVRSHL